MSEASEEAAESILPLDPAVVDITLKVLSRAAPAAFFRLAGIVVDPARIRHSDVTVAISERRADHVYLVMDTDGTPEWGLYIECQMQPQRRTLRKWAAKWGNLSDHHDLDLILLALYLHRGDRATFPDQYSVAAGGWSTELRFQAVRLWEHAERIRSGELVQFAPLLVLWEDSPTETVIEEERNLLRAAPLTAEERADLLGCAYAIGTRYLARAVLDAIFGEELPMLKDLGIISEWMEESEARGRAEGEASGRAEGIRQTLLHVLERRFGPVPEVLHSRIMTADPSWCNALLDRALVVESYNELQAGL
jgi:predicted transposase YdaD